MKKQSARWMKCVLFIRKCEVYTTDVYNNTCSESFFTLASIALCLRIYYIASLKMIIQLILFFSPHFHTYKFNSFAWWFNGVDKQQYMCVYRLCVHCNDWILMQLPWVRILISTSSVVRKMQTEHRLLKVKTMGHSRCIETHCKPQFR